MKTETITDAVARTGLTRDCFYRLIKAKQIAVVRLSPTAQYRIVSESLDSYLRKHLQPAVSENESQPLPAVVDADRDLPAIDAEAAELFR